MDLGNKFKPKETKERPGLSIYCPDTLKTPGLVVALTDPDAKSRNDPKWSEMCHVSNVYSPILDLKTSGWRLGSTRLLFVLFILAIVF